MVPNRKSRKQNRRKPNRETIPAGMKIQGSGTDSVFVKLPIEIFIGKLTTTVTTGVIASTTAIQAALNPNFAARFGVVFDEYMILSAIIKFDTCSSTLPGSINAWIESAIGNSAAPTLTDAKQNKTLTFPAGANQRTHKIIFNPRNVNTQAWTLCTTTTAVCGYLKVYTNNADYGSSVAATDYLVVTGVLNIAFRNFV
jgi:hypothetical protein